MKELPEFVHRKVYSNYYLFSDCEILRNESFNKKIKLFSKKISGEKVVIEMLLMDWALSHIGSKFFIIPNNESYSFEKFDEKCIEFGNGSIFFYSSFNFYVYDETNEWELYCSTTQDIAIFGCNRSILNEFLNIFNPYKEESFKEKMNWIGNIFKESYRSEYLNKLKNNYQFSE
ncbi:MAG: hypothetical protein WCK02_12280 [Bacteroidota bacterium]